MRREGDEYRAGAAVGFNEDYIEFLDGHPLEVNRGTVTGAPCWKARPVHILDVADRSRIHASRIHHAGPAAHRARRAADARERADRRDRAGAPARRSVHAEADRSRHHLRRPGRDRHRERPPVRRGASARRCERADQQTAAEVLQVISSSPSASQPVFDTMPPRRCICCGAFSNGCRSAHRRRHRSTPRPSTAICPAAYDEPCERPSAAMAQASEPAAGCEGGKPFRDHRSSGVSNPTGRANSEIAPCAAAARCLLARAADERRRVRSA